MTDQPELDLSVWWIGAGVLLILTIWCLYDWFQVRRRQRRNHALERLKRFRR